MEKISKKIERHASIIFHNMYDMMQDFKKQREELDVSKNSLHQLLEGMNILIDSKIEKKVSSELEKITMRMN